MPFQPVPDVALVRVRGVIDGQLTINTTYWEISGSGISLPALDGLANAVGTWAQGTLAPLLSDDWSLTGVEAIDLSTQNGPAVTYSYNQAGGVSGESNPNNVAMCVSFRTSLRGRSYRGRNYVPGIPGSVVTLNTLDNTFITNVLAAYNALPGAGTFLAGWQLGVVSRVQGGSPLSNGIITPVIFVISTSPYVRSMRSREVGHGA
jgi:hypothetical protein